MGELYWKIDPEVVVKQNKYFKQGKGNSQLKRSIAILCEEYKKITKEIKKLIEQINGKNFEKNMLIIFDKEAYLAEIYFYLSEDILLNTVEKDILKLIRKDYLLSYQWRLSEMNQKETVDYLLMNWTKDKNYK